jgi:hypothetical protein
MGRRTRFRGGQADEVHVTTIPDMRQKMLPFFSGFSIYARNFRSKWYDFREIFLQPLNEQ